MHSFGIRRIVRMRTKATPRRVWRALLATAVIAAFPVVVSATAGGSGVRACTPSVTGITPSSGPTSGGVLVTISTQCDYLPDVTAIAFGTQNATPPFPIVPPSPDRGSTQIQATAPRWVTSEPMTVDVRLTGLGGTTGITEQDQFTYIPMSISPTSGPQSGFGSSPATTFNVASDTSMTATSPPGKGTVCVAVTTGFGQSVCSGTTNFTYVPPSSTTTSSPTTSTTGTAPPAPGSPTLTLDPPLGPPGQPTVLTGSGFPANANVTLTWPSDVEGSPSTATTSSSGSIDLSVLFFLHDQLGKITITATVTGSAASANYLIVPNTMQPAGSSLELYRS
jgi:hypothetical protein